VASQCFLAIRDPSTSVARSITAIIPIRKSFELLSVSLSAFLAAVSTALETVPNALDVPVPRHGDRAIAGGQLARWFQPSFRMAPVVRSVCPPSSVVRLDAFGVAAHWTL
jgi:hypothetical protein